MNIHLLLQSLQQTINEQAAIIVKLKDRILVLENKKNSGNSHIPPSQDQNRVKQNQSLREATTKKVGGQPGHEGTTLACSKVVDIIIKHSPAQCNGCHSNLDNSTEQLISTRQLIDIPPIALQVIEHQVYKKQCSCGYTTVSAFPKHVASPVQYGPNVESLIGYLHARQYLPYERTK